MKHYDLYVTPLGARDSFHQVVAARFPLDAVRRYARSRASLGMISAIERTHDYSWKVIGTSGETFDVSVREL